MHRRHNLCFYNEVTIENSACISSRIVGSDNIHLNLLLTAIPDQPSHREHFVIHNVEIIITTDEKKVDVVTVQFIAVYQGDVRNPVLWWA